MIDITDKNYKPDIGEITELIGNGLFGELCAHMENEYKAQYEIAYSGDKVLLGWNVRFCKSGRTLCRVYPVNGFFSVLIVIGPKESERTRELLPELSEEMRNIYFSTPEGMGQRWMVFDLKERNGLYEDLLKLVKIRRG